jgi:hypothetical protein
MAPPPPPPPFATVNAPKIESDPLFALSVNTPEPPAPTVTLIDWFAVTAWLGKYKYPPAPPPPPARVPPAPPPPTTRMSAFVTPLGIDKLQIPTVVNLRIVYPPLDASVGEQVAYDEDRVKVAVLEPDVFVAVIVYVTALLISVGVPEINPVEVDHDRPAKEKAGEME